MSKINSSSLEKLIEIFGVLTIEDNNYKIPTITDDFKESGSISIGIEKDKDLLDNICENLILCGDGIRNSFDINVYIPINRNIELSGYDNVDYLQKKKEFIGSGLDKAQCVIRKNGYNDNLYFITNDKNRILTFDYNKGIEIIYVDYDFEDLIGVVFTSDSLKIIKDENNYFGVGILRNDTTVNIEKTI